MKITNKILILILVSLTLLKLFPLLFTGFATADDLEYYINGLNGKYLEHAKIYAQGQGRFFFFISFPITEFLYHTNLYLIKFINILLVGTNILLIGLIVNRIIDNKLFSLWVCFVIIIFFPVSGLFNPVVSYPTMFTGAFSFVLLSFLFALNYQRFHKKYFVYLSAIMFMFSICFYEVFLMYLPLIVVVLLYKELFHEKISVATIKRIFLIFLPYLILLITYFLIYISFKKIYPSSYLGTVMGNFSIINSLKVIARLSSGAFPLHFSFTSAWAFGATKINEGDIMFKFYIIITEHLDWLFKSIFIALICFYILGKIDSIKKKVSLLLLFIALIYVYAPLVPLAFSEKYLNNLKEYGGIPNYVPTYFSYYSVSILIAVLILFIVFIKKNFIKKIAIVIISVFMAIFSLINDYSSFETYKFLQTSRNMLNFLEKFSQSEEYKSLPNESVIYAPQLFDGYMNDMNYLYGQGFNWQHFLFYKSQKTVYYVKNWNEISNSVNTTSNNFYYLTYSRDQVAKQQFIAITKITPASILDSTYFISDNVNLIVWLKNNNFEVTASINNNAEDTIIINGLPFSAQRNFLKYKFLKKQIDSNLSYIKLNASKIDINSITVSGLFSNGVPIEIQN